jgi:hypothetical protein
MYNFRFDANVAPTMGAATITLFKPGPPDSVSTAPGSIKVPGTPPPPPCACDFNLDSTLNSQDFFDFVSALLAGNVSADFNHDGTVNSQDFFDFLNCFFNPPPGC